jgi:hypothetical protein
MAMAQDTKTVEIEWVYDVSEEANIDGFEVLQCEYDQTGNCSPWRVVTPTPLPPSARSFGILGIPVARSFGFVVHAVKDGVRSDMSNAVIYLPPAKVHVTIEVTGPSNLTIK